MTEVAGTAFGIWLAKVDHRLESVVGLSYQDLPDRNWRDQFEDGMSPREAADLALEDEGFDEEDF